HAHSAMLAPGTLMIPLWVRNGTARTQEIILAAVMHGGWTAQSGTGRFTVAAKKVASARIEVNLPAPPEKSAPKAEPLEVTVHADSNGQSVGEIKLRVELRKRALPQ